MKPSPKNARALRLLRRTDAVIRMNEHTRYGAPSIGEFDTEANMIGKEIRLERRNVRKMLDEGWIERVHRGDRWEDNPAVWVLNFELVEPEGGFGMSFH